MVDISATIFRKIENAAVFVADMTSIGRSEGGKRVMQNPNVLIELGYALKTLGPSQVILVANQSYGGKPEDLPFDVRHRRGPILYKLSKEDPPEVVDQEKQKLVDALADALTTCLQNAIAKEHAEVEIQRHKHGEDCSVWFNAHRRLQHRSWMPFRAAADDVEVLKGPRTYMRIIPAGWKNRKPDSTTVRNLNPPLGLQPFGEWHQGGAGINEEGVLCRPLGARDETGVHHVDTVSQWFESTGELWGIEVHLPGPDGTAYFAEDQAVNHWHAFMKRGLAMFSHLEARPPYIIEAGVIGIKSLLWPHPQAIVRYTRGVRDSATHEERSSAWTPDEQLNFLLKLCDEVRRAFGLSQAKESDIKKHLRD
ncbi:hypothetical protein COEX109129_16705 [Corallococcus exiguus]